MKIFGQSVLAIVIMDIAFVFILMIGIATGADVQHIPFWDSQIKAVVSLIN